MVDDKSGLSTVRFFHMFALDIINLYLVAAAAFGIIGGKLSGFFKNAVGKFFAACFYDDVGAGSPFGMKPPVASICKVEGQLFVLKIIFSDIDMVAVTGQLVEGTAF